jgi:hypothetical protein
MLPPPAPTTVPAAAPGASADMDLHIPAICPEAAAERARYMRFSRRSVSGKAPPQVVIKFRAAAKDSSLAFMLYILIVYNIYNNNKYNN